MQVKLLNDGGYDLDEVEFPVIVEATERENGLIVVSGTELKRVGGDDIWFDSNYQYAFERNEYKRIL